MPLVAIFLFVTLTSGAQAQSLNQSPIPTINLAQSNCLQCATLPQQACVDCATRLGFTAKAANNWCAQNAHCRKKIKM